VEGVDLRRAVVQVGYGVDGMSEFSDSVKG